MNGRVQITLDDGSIVNGTIVFDSNRVGEGVPTEPPLKYEAHKSKLDFSIPLRPFVNEHTDGMSGSKKFALLVAHFAKGEVDAHVDRTEVIESWNKMTGLLGGKFNNAHEARAKDSGWVYVPVSGKVALLKKWTEVLA